jgi:quercetin dioxygenase-like cupin family protein
MAIPHAKPGDVIDVRPLGSALLTTKTTTLFRTDKLEVVRLVMEAGKEIAEHQAPSELIVQCLEGKVEFFTLGKFETLTAGSLLYLPANEPHSLKCREDASMLLTMLLR